MYGIRADVDDGVPSSIEVGFKLFCFFTSLNINFKITKMTIKYTFCTVNNSIFDILFFTC